MSKSKNVLQKIWYLIWEDDSAISWILNIILAFVLIKFVIYPVLGLLLGTGFPIVAVVSGSMEHPGSFDDWWLDPYCCVDLSCKQRFNQATTYANLDISKSEVKSFTFPNGFNTGDIMVLKKPNRVELGDTIVFMISAKSDPIIHRVVEISKREGKTFYTTKGDHNCGISPFEREIPEDKVIGEALFRVPFLGYVKLVFVKAVSGIVGVFR